MCVSTLLLGLIGFILLVVPLIFYAYERCCGHSAHWCQRKTFMLFGALLICVGLGVPALRIVSAIMCSS